MVNEEMWKDIEGYEGLYQISNLGRVKSLDRVIDKYHHVKEKILQLQINKRGYYTLMLSKNGVAKRFEIHRLVGLNFITNNSECFNHIDGDKLNNNLNNLEPCTFSENINHAVDVLNVHGKALNVIIIDSNDNNKYLFNSMRKAEKFLNKKQHWLKQQRRRHGDILMLENFIINISGGKHNE